MTTQMQYRGNAAAFNEVVDVNDALCCLNHFFQ